jgi:hypothetical protein
MKLLWGRALGGRAGIPTRQEVEQFLESGPPTVDPESQSFSPSSSNPAQAEREPYDKAFAERSVLKGVTSGSLCFCGAFSGRLPCRRGWAAWTEVCETQGNLSLQNRVVRL